MYKKAYETEEGMKIEIEVNGEVGKIMEDAEKLEQERKIQSVLFKKALLESFTMQEEDQVYVIHIVKSKDGKANIGRVNHNFSAFELMGLCDYLKEEVQKQIEGLIESEKLIVKRYVTEMEEKK